MTDPRDRSSTEGNGHDQSVQDEDIEKENVQDEIYEDRGERGNGQQQEEEE